MLYIETDFYPFKNEHKEQYTHLAKNKLQDSEQKDTRILPKNSKNQPSKNQNKKKKTWQKGV